MALGSCLTHYFMNANIYRETNDMFILKWNLHYKSNFGFAKLSMGYSLREISIMQYFKAEVAEMKIRNRWKW